MSWVNILQAAGITVLLFMCVYLIKTIHHIIIDWRFNRMLKKELEAKAPELEANLDDKTKEELEVIKDIALIGSVFHKKQYTYVLQVIDCFLFNMSMQAPSDDAREQLFEALRRLPDNVESNVKKYKDRNK